MVLGFGLAVGLAGCADLSDEAMIERFETQREAFEELADLAPTCGYTRREPFLAWLPVDVFGSRSAVTPENEQCAELLRTLRLRSVFTSGEELHLETQGLKGYVKRPTEPERLYTNLDEMPADLPPYGFAYRHVAGDWYITYYNPTDAPPESEP